LLISAQDPQKIEFLTFIEGQQPPVDRIVQAIYASMRSRRLDKAAVMADWETLEKLESKLDAEYLEPDANFHWSGTQRTYSLKKNWKRIQLGDYEQWFQWFMTYQRFRAFHVLVIVEPMEAVADEERGGYYDGLLARLIQKVTYKIIIVQTPKQTRPGASNQSYIREALMAILYGTRLSFDELAYAAKEAIVPLGDDESLKKELQGQWLWRFDHSRYRLSDDAEKLVEGMLPPRFIHNESEVRPMLHRNKRSGPMHTLPKEMLEKLLLEDLDEKGWLTAYGEWVSFFERLDRLAHEDGSMIWNYFWGKDVGRQDIVDALRPQARLLRRILDGMFEEGKLETKKWFREIGRPTKAYFTPGRAPFLDSRCGQCAFYVSAKRRCRLWWLANKKWVFYDERWKQPSSTVTRFEIHKMRWASRIGPHASACQRFIDKKRDHNRKHAPERCEICNQSLEPRGKSFVIECTNCGTKYRLLGDKVKVQTAYRHEYNRLYHEITGSDATKDLDAWKANVKERLALILEQRTETEDLDLLAEESVAEEPPRVWPSFNQELQAKVDRLAATTDIARRLSGAMAQSARNATLRVIEIARLHESSFGRAIVNQEKYIALIDQAGPTQFLTYEALIMKEYWRCYGEALRLAQQWFGPRKKSRFVPEFVEDPAGRARGYSPLDAAVNYLHQRRLRQAERNNAAVGFSGTCDGFLHKERHNSRGIGLLLDMIDPFKFSDREMLLAVVLNGGISWRDFGLENDRRGSTFYYPASSGRGKLDLAGADADNMVVSYRSRQMPVSEALKELASGLLGALDAVSPDNAPLEPFVFTPT
jgi:ribosomal protein L37AE/L43A